MFRAFSSLALFCVFSSVAVSQQVQVHPNPVRVPTSAVWEYGLLFYTEQPASGPRWLSADTTRVLNGVLYAIAATPNPPSGVGPPTIVRLLNLLGAEGWELISAPSFPGSPYYVFKRQAPRSGTTH